jgi:hypothetical protein
MDLKGSFEAMLANKKFKLIPSSRSVYRKARAVLRRIGCTNFQGAFTFMD